MNNNDIFLEFWKSYQWPTAKPLMYRLYHDDRGNVLEYSMEEKTGNYVEITPEQYARADRRVRVIDGKITYPPPPRPPRLTVAQTGTPCHPHNVCVVVDQSQPHVKWSLKNNED